MSELLDAVAHGLPRAVVPQLAARAAPDRGDMRRKVAALIVSPATYKRSRRLSPAASEAERLARVTALALQALGDDDEAREWLNVAHPLLSHHTPIETAATDLGARMVERLLHNIEYSLPA
ncbi:MAG TPA: antitoxin Xre/MbcA/ParS toxin-binding domain-containing protein [Acetobacteraceae bacterium]